MKSEWDVIVAAIASLQNNGTGLPARVAAFNAEPGHGVVLAAPVNAAYYKGGSDLLAVNGFPAVEVYVPRGGYGPFAVNRVAADMDDSLIVRVWAEAERGELEELYETIVGLKRCALEVLVVKDAFGAGVEIANEPAAVTWDYVIAPDDPENRNFQKWQTNVELRFKLEDVTAIP